MALAGNKFIGSPCNTTVGSVSYIYTSQCYKTVITGAVGNQTFSMNYCGEGCCKTIWDWVLLGAIPRPPISI